MLVSDLIDLSFLNLGVIQPGMSITSSMQSDAFTRLNQLLSSLSIEGASAFNQVLQSFNLSAGTVGYTLGASGSFATAGGLRAVKCTAWKATYSNLMTRGGAVLSIPEFDAAASQEGGETSSLPKIVGADTAYPNLNVRVFPPPSSAPGTLELAYWTPITAFATVGDTISLPDGWVDMLHFNLAVRLYPQYARTGGIPAELAANAQNTKAAIVAQNTGTAPQPQQ